MSNVKNKCNITRNVMAAGGPIGPRDEMPAGGGGLDLLHLKFQESSLCS